jgi:cobyrinic acid a,c-diamide synthase
MWRAETRRMSIPSVVIAGTHSGVGKTTISIALMAALVRRGLSVQPFKVGPDFIDPTLHTKASGRVCRNLDGWMLGPTANSHTFSASSAGADVAVVEGVMGLFDGRDAVTEAGSTAEMAKLLGLPVVLVVDASAMARSAAALLHGYESFDEELNVAGVIFNRVAGEGHFAYLRESAAARCRASVLGWLPRDENVTLPERHLGLFMADEVLDDSKLGTMAFWLEAGFDVDALLQLARGRSRANAHGAESITSENTDGASDKPEIGPCGSGGRHQRKPRIGVARDKAFCFYYQDNLDLLRHFGAEIVEFSPLADRRLPAALDGLYFGGGYPELYAAALSANESMRCEVAHFSRSGAPVYAECGGLMYLTEAIVDAEGGAHPMVGIFPTKARMQNRLAALGYREVSGVCEAGWLRLNERGRGHEFRHSTIDEMPEVIPRCYSGVANGESSEGFQVGATVASYVHLHFGSCPEFAARFVAACAGS